jgi:hypothetical protein
LTSGRPGTHPGKRQSAAGKRQSAGGTDVVEDPGWQVCPGRNR